MTLDELRADVRAALRRDPREARRLARRYARRGAAEPLRVAEARLFLAEAEYVAGRPRAALPHFDAARRAFARLKARRHLLATDLGAIQVHALLGDAAAVRRLAKRLARTEGAIPGAMAANAAGTALDALGDERAAETSFRTALRRIGRGRTAAAGLVRATAQANLAVRLARRGAAAEARRHFDAALAFFEGAGHAGPAAETRHNRGWAAGVAGDAAAALQDLRAAAARFAAAGDARRAALAAADEAELALRLGDHDHAARLATEAAADLDRAGAIPEAARARLLAARAHARAGRGAAAARLAKRARTAFARAADAAGTAAADVVLGRDLARAERTLAAKGHLPDALDALVRRARKLPPRRAAGVLARRAAAYPAVLRRWVEPELCLHAAAGADRLRLLRRGVRAAEALRHLAPTGRWRAASLASHLEVYESLAAALLERGRAADRREAFRVLDAARARTLREELEREAPGLADAPAVAEARARLEALWRAADRGPGASGGLRGAAPALWKDIARCERELTAALEGAEAPPSPLTPGAARGPCLAWAEVRGEVVALRLQQDGDVTTWSCGDAAALRAEMDAFRFQVARRLHGAEDAGPAEGCLARLGDALLHGLLPPLPPTLTLLLPPALADLPVEALPWRGAPLSDATALAFAPAAGVPARRWRAGSALVVGFGGERLPAVRRELAYLRRRWPRAHVLARREEILAALPAARLVHLAGHARARADLPLLSALQVEDGWITASDLQARPLRGALVVLSACRTGDPSLPWRGEAWGGFPRALLAAGAAAVVGSRWEVRDETALAWMRAFHDRLGRLGPERALAGAARDVRRRFSHPADRAAFLLVRGGIS